MSFSTQQLNLGNTTYLVVTNNKTGKVTVVEGNKFIDIAGFLDNYELVVDLTTEHESTRKTKTRGVVKFVKRFGLVGNDGEECVRKNNTNKIS